MSRILLFLVVVSVLLIAGCQGQGPTDNYVQEDYHIGTQGIEMRFIPNSPPYKVFEGDRLDISIELLNRGAWPVEESLRGKLEISGFDPVSIKGQWDGGNFMPINLEGRSQNNDEGGFAVMEYKDRDGVHVPFDADLYEPTIIVHACYEYKTIANPVVCIDPDPFEIVEEDRVCEIQDIGLGGGQGAPIAVTRVEQEIGSDQIYFRIFIANVGSGSVMLPNSFNNCPFDVEFNDLEKVTAKIKLPHDASPDCSPKGTQSDPVWIRNNRGVIFCKFNKPASDSAYTTNLNIELDYVYSESIRKQLKIINLQ